MTDPPRVFISYAHEPGNPAHGERVLALADRLRDDGLESRLDQYVSAPEKGWRLWMEDEIEEADFVLMVATETYEQRRRGKEEPGGNPGGGKGVRWEGAIIGQALYDEKLANTRFIPVVFEDQDRKHVPPFLGDFPTYNVATENGYDALYRRLTEQPEVEAPPIGEIRERPRRTRRGVQQLSTQVAIAKLPVTGETFVARKAELALLDSAWESGLNVLSFVAEGGAGKSALINQWLGQMQKDGWRGGERILGWSFYSQGTDAVGASSDAFSEFALDWLGYSGDVITSPWKKGDVLAGLVRQSKALLILDGLEPLQHPPGPQKGRIKDPTIQALVKELSADNPGLCVITTRLEVADVAGKAGTESVDLEKLPPEAGAELLRALEVQGSEQELQEASKELHGHGLALTLLGTYLRDICNGDIRRRGEATVLDETVGIEQSDHAKKVMAAYESWFAAGPGNGIETRVLRLLGLFDRPAEPAALDALRKAPEIPGLTEGLGAENEAQWKAALARLRQARLVAPTEKVEAGNLGAGEALDTHPLVREYFVERLLRKNPEAWKEGNDRLYGHYCQTAPDFPDTLEEMLLLYAAVIHGCRAGKEQEAAEVLSIRAMRGPTDFSWKHMGTLGAELAALAAFYRNNWENPTGHLPNDTRSWVLATTGHHLRAVGRLREALPPTRLALTISIGDGDLQNAAITASTLSELTLMLGLIEESIETARDAVNLAQRSSDAWQLTINQAALADALLQSGQQKQSEVLFGKAERLQSRLVPQIPGLYSVLGFKYRELILGLANLEPRSGSRENLATRRAKVLRVIDSSLALLDLSSENGWLLDIALSHLSLGKAYLAEAVLIDDDSPDLRRSAEHLNLSIVGLRNATRIDYLPHGLLARAALRRLDKDPGRAAEDLREAQEIAERGSMRLHEADAHLEWTRLHLATDDHDAAGQHLDQARTLIRECGYGRREREVTWLENQLSDAS